MSSKDKNAKVNSKDKKKVNPKSIQNDDDLGGNNPAANIKDIIETVKRNKSTSFIVFLVGLMFFLIVYFQIKYDQQQRFSPDSMKENADVY